MRLVALTLLVCCVVSLPAGARAGCEQRRDRTAERAFGDSWSDAPCRDDRTADDALLDFRDDREPPLRRTLGIAGLGSGAALLGTGGLLLLSSLFLADGGTPQKVTRYGGIGLAATGGAFFLTGAVLTVVDLAAAPAPTPDGRGGPIVDVFTF